jgi:nitrogen-specific signal transduction histidine kinase
MSRLYEALRKMEEDRLMQIEKDDPPVHELENSDSPEENRISLSPLFLVETLRDIKKTVGSIYKIGLLSMERSESNENREHSRMVMTKAYDQIISTVDMLSSYINVTSPIAKKNTIHWILEEILESNEKKLHARKIELKKTLAEELPETIFQDEQVRFILNLVLQYAILSTPSGGSIEIVTQFVNDQKEQDLSSLDPQKSKYSEILISSSGPKYPLSEPPGAPEVPKIERDGTSHFILRLVREMIRRNQGMIDFQTDQMKSRTRISLKFPVERRRLAYYRPANL